MTDATQALLPVTPELLPCPFCGTNSLRIIEVAPIASNYRRVSHDADKAGFGCFVSGPIRVGEDEAIAAWNTRNPAHSLPGDVGTVLADHFPSGVRGLFERTAQGMPVRTHVGTDCACGWCIAATDEHEVRQQWAEHVAAALTPSALSGDAGEGE